MPRAFLFPMLVCSLGLAVGLAACGWESSELAGDAGGDGTPRAQTDAAHDGGHDARHSTHEASPDVIDEDPPDGPFVMAKHPPLPQLVNSPVSRPSLRWLLGLPMRNMV